MLAYAYVADSNFVVYPILGSLVRAIGKDWRVIVVSPKTQQSLFQAFQNQLALPNYVEIYSFEKLTPALAKDHQHLDLILSLYQDSKINQKIRDFVLGKAHIMTVDQKPTDSYDLISHFAREELRKKGVIAITGTGKGKTTSALGIAMERFLTVGKKVAVVQWFKEKKDGNLTWAINEHHFPEHLKNPDNFSIYPTGSGFVGSPKMDRIREEKQHLLQAEHGLRLAQTLIRSGEYSCIVLDEFVDTLQSVMAYLPYSLLQLSDVQELLREAQHAQTKVIVTGRKVTDDWADFIQTSIVISSLRHPFATRGAGAISGLDF